jgi:hypothetical protein
LMLASASASPAADASEVSAAAMSTVTTTRDGGLREREGVYVDILRRGDEVLAFLAARARFW